MVFTALFVTTDAPRARIPVSNAVTAMEVGPLTSDILLGSPEGTDCVQVWLLACMMLVFLSLVEYAVILRWAEGERVAKKL